MINTEDNISLDSESYISEGFIVLEFYLYRQRLLIETKVTNFKWITAFCLLNFFKAKFKKLLAK